MQDAAAYLARGGQAVRAGSATRGSDRGGWRRRAVWTEFGAGPAARRRWRSSTRDWRMATDHPLRVRVRCTSYRGEDPGRAGAPRRSAGRHCDEVGYGSADRLGDQLIVAAYAHWELLGSSPRCRATATAALHHAQQAEADRGDWWQVDGAEDCLAEAADRLDRVGHMALASEYLERAKRTRPGDAEPLIAMSEGALLARHGDPELARGAACRSCTGTGSAPRVLAGHPAPGLRRAGAAARPARARSRRGRSRRPRASASRAAADPGAGCDRVAARAGGRRRDRRPRWRSRSHRCRWRSRCSDASS